MQDTKIGTRIRIEFSEEAILEGVVIAKDDIGISVVTDEKESYSVQWQDILPRMFQIVKPEDENYQEAA